MPVTSRPSSTFRQIERSAALGLASIGAVSAKTVGAPKGATKVYTFRASDGEWDRYQDRVFVSGWQLANYNANPVVLYNHDAGDGGLLGLGRKDVLPIGKGHAYVQGDALLVDICFDPDDEFAQRVQAKVDGGFLRAVSVRYVMKRYEDNERGGVDSFEHELLEISCVTIPGNQRAVHLETSETAKSAARMAASSKSAADEAAALAPYLAAVRAMDAAAAEARKSPTQREYERIAHLRRNGMI